MEQPLVDQPEAQGAIQQQPDRIGLVQGVDYNQIPADMALDQLQQVYTEQQANAILNQQKFQQQSQQIQQFL